MFRLSSDDYKQQNRENIEKGKCLGFPVNGYDLAVKIGDSGLFIQFYIVGGPYTILT